MARTNPGSGKPRSRSLVAVVATFSGCHHGYRFFGIDFSDN
jgi:hypothetical protein